MGHLLAGKTAWVTGAGSGIGLACAMALAEAGAVVTLVDINASTIEHEAAQLGGRAITVDLSDRDAVMALDVDTDILVNNAGFQHVAPVHEFPPEIFAKLQALMVESPFLLARSALPKMYARNFGRIVNISSLHGLRASPFKSAYVTAKHGLEGLSKVIALEGAPHGVTSNCICPGYVRTPLVENQIRDQAAAHGISEQDVVEKVMLTQSAIKRLAEPSEVAALAVYLCGVQASYITGTSMTIDGGWSAR